MSSSAVGGRSPFRPTPSAHCKQLTARTAHTAHNATAHGTLHTAHSEPHIACTEISAHCKLPIANSEPHSAHNKLNTAIFAHGTSHMAQRILHTAHLTWHRGYCTLQAHCTLQNALETKSTIFPTSLELI